MGNRVKILDTSGNRATVDEIEPSPKVSQAQVDIVDFEAAI